MTDEADEADEADKLSMVARDFAGVHNNASFPGWETEWSLKVEVFITIHQSLVNFLELLLFALDLACAHHSLGVSTSAIQIVCQYIGGFWGVRTNPTWWFIPRIVLVG